uniref:Hexosyltransferase n=1 Tax=Panagrolaimus sp. PS1159 TaxID=55785 RepID=A0AC35GWV9_9BILA
MSSPSDSEIRETIRNTWFKQSAKGPAHFRWIFPIYLAFLTNVTESYDNLAQKTAQTISYSTKNYDFQFLLKADSDSFVRVGSILKSLRDIANPRLYWEFLDGRSKPFRFGKWKEIDWMLCVRYLPSLHYLKYYISENVLLGVWLEGTNAKYVHDPRFDKYQSRGCNNEYLVKHKKSPQQMKALFANMQQTGKLCFIEFQAPPSYIYDFSVLPSQCCTRRNNSVIP